MTVTSNLEEQFASAMAAHGLEPAEIIADGKLHRFDGPEEKRGKKSAWYVLHADGIPAGKFGDWRIDLNEGWSAKTASTMTDSERSAYRQHMDASRAAESAARTLRAADAQAEVTKHWENGAGPIKADHPYVVTKRIKPAGAKQMRDQIVVPLRDIDNVIRSAQYITPDGKKRFKTGGTVAGCYCGFGGDPTARGTLLICEGWATACTLYQATRYPVAAAMSAGNLLPVAQALRGKYPSLTIIVCGDDDAGTVGNPGKTKAIEAAQAIGASYAIPSFGTERPSGATDFNDLACLDGIEAVSAAVAVAIKPARAAPPPAGIVRPSVMLSCADDITPEAITWLWPGWLPAGKLTIMAGSPGTGKTTLALALAATVSRGSLWPDGTRHKAPGTLLMWSSEDDPADTLVPRLIAAGADLKKIHFIKSVSNQDGELDPFDPSRDIPLLGERMAQMGGAQLMILDPIVSAVSGDAHRVNDVRRDLQALVDMAGAYRCAVLGISHFAKGGKGTTPAERVIGSQAFVALARMVLVAAKDEAAERRILARAKSNIAPDDGGVSYTLEQVTTDGIEASRVVWGEAIEGSAREILGEVEETDDEAKTERGEAADFLASLLSDGPLSSKTIRKDADEAGFAWRTMHRAADSLGVEKRKLGMKEGWHWALPKMPNCEDATERATLLDVASSQTSGTFRKHGGFTDAPDAHSAEDATPDRVTPSQNSLSSSAPDANMEV